MRLIVLEVLSGVILLIVPVVGGLIGLIVARFLRLSPIVSRRLVGSGVLLASPCVAYGPGGWSLQPAVHVVLEQFSGQFSLVNLSSVVLTVMLVGGGYLVVERTLNASSTKGSRS